MAKKIVKQAATSANERAITMEPPVRYERIALSVIDSSPMNYRKLFPMDELQELAASIRDHDVIENLTVRPLPSGRFQVVTGERRFRAAGIAGKTDVPCMIRDYTDEQVREIQLAENVHRQNPTPLEEAQAFQELLAIHKSIDVVVSKVGKAKSYIYGRLKLNALIPAIQEMLMAEKFTLQEAIRLASLAETIQQQFFTDYCADWQQADFERPDVAEAIERFTYDLTSAPFPLDNTTLNPVMGGCTGCPFNTATASLFPDLAAKPVCMNTSCFDLKADNQFLTGLRGVISLELPMALLYQGAPSPYLRRMIEQVPELVGIPTYNYYQIDTVDEPEAPLAEDYTYEGDEEEAEELDAEGFQLAQEEYEADKFRFEQQLNDKELLKGLLLTERKWKYVLFNPETKRMAGFSREETRGFTAKEVQVAIKAGTATLAMLTGERERLEQKARRDRQLDREKVQQTIYAKVSEMLKDGRAGVPLTEKDWPVVWFLILRSMDWSGQSSAESVLWPSDEDDSSWTGEDDWQYLHMEKLTLSQIGWLVRKAALSKAESKSPTSDYGYCLYQLAEGLSIDTGAVKLAQEDKAATREEKVEARVRDLNKRIKRMESKNQPPAEQAA